MGGKKKGNWEVRYRESKNILEKNLRTEGSEEEGLGLRKEKTHQAKLRAPSVGSRYSPHKN